MAANKELEDLDFRSEKIFHRTVRKRLYSSKIHIVIHVTIHVKITKCLINLYDVNSECRLCSLLSMFTIVASISILTSEWVQGAITDYHGADSKHNVGINPYR